jgi:hypothetical protein
MYITNIQDIFRNSSSDKAVFFAEDNPKVFEFNTIPDSNTSWVVSNNILEYMQGLSWYKSAS